MIAATGSRVPTWYWSEAVQKHLNLSLLGGRQTFVLLAHSRRLSTVAHYGRFSAGGVSVVHQILTEPQAPERWCAELVCGGLVQVFGLGGLRDAVSCADIVQLE